MVLVTLWGGVGCGSSQAVRGSHPDGVHPGLRQRGKASFYSSSLAGRPTASGEPYRPEKRTAAHLELPLGTVVRVYRLSKDGVATGQSVEVRINDRGPYGPGRILDLSLAAARALDMVRTGVVLVEVEVLSVPEKRRKRGERQRR
ncbi:MAG: septal ring lytic transglycosylase RlpA family protein [Deltaproteobacteria bacterium]|nr:septal ring lytic transglycosylase RlpA family protein [Deltaproteobacteria bacterium]